MSFLFSNVDDDVVGGGKKNVYDARERESEKG